MPSPEIVPGMRVGLLTAVKYTGKAVQDRKVWEWACDCGNTCERQDIIVNRKYANPSSCGCFMRKKQTIDHSGKRYGMVVAINRVGKRGAKSSWAVRCDCGNVVERSISDFVSDGAKSCGCLVRNWRSGEGAKEVDYTGQRFGAFVVIKKTGRKHGGAALWEVHCDCGSVVFKKPSQFKQVARKRSCGCKPSLYGFSEQELILRKEFFKKTSEAARKRKKEDPVFAVSNLMRHLLSYAANRAGLSVTSKFKNEFFQTCGYQPEDLVSHIESLFWPGMTWANRGRDKRKLDKGRAGWEIDHIVPLSTAEDIEDVIRLNKLSNLQPLWWDDNLAKSGKLDYDVAGNTNHELPSRLKGLC